MHVPAICTGDSCGSSQSRTGTILRPVGVVGYHVRLTRERSTVRLCHRTAEARPDQDGFAFGLNPNRPRMERGGCPFCPMPGSRTTRVSVQNFFPSFQAWDRSHCSFQWRGDLDASRHVRAQHHETKAWWPIGRLEKRGSGSPSLA